MENTKDFDLGDVLSITTGILLSLRNVSGVYDILKFMTGADIFTHQIPDACRECRPALLEQHPALNGITVPKLGPDTFVAWLDQAKANYGETLPVKALADRAKVYSDPIGDLTKLGKPVAIIALSPQGEGS